MKTFEEEYAELIEWIKTKNKEYMEAARKENVRGKGSKLDSERRQVVKEYNRRLIGLKEKYNRVLSEQDQQWKNLHL